ncbi:MAG: hypothetical protein H5U13_02470 [Parvibaculum sp.]|nr:hypothetical protein [Parvibaculum sp.]
MRENGVPLDTFKVKSERTGRMIGAYKFADPSKIKNGRIGGRAAFSKQFKEAMLAHYGSRNTITGERLDGRYLQIDHRIPYEVAGDEAFDEGDLTAYMLLDASSQRAKSWSCENCRNATELLDEGICRGCFWAFPEDYTHVAMRPERRAEVVWSDGEVAAYDRLKESASARGITVGALLKELASKS